MSRRIPNILGLFALVACTHAYADVTISSYPTKHMSCSAGVCTPTAATANLNVGDLQAMLAASSVTVKSSAAAPDIGIMSALTWASASTLTLDAYRSVAISKSVSITGTAGLTVTTNDGGSGGSLSFPAMGRAIFWDLGSSLTINGIGYTLVGDIATLASDVMANASGHYALANDYDASVDGAYQQPPVIKPLDGSFEGLGNTITRLTLRVHHRFGYMGLFDYLDPSGAISDLRLTRLSARGPRGGTTVMGGIVASASGLMSGDTVSGTMISANGGFIGGLAGVQTSGGTITGATSTVTITAGGDPVLGAVAGEVQGTMTASHGAGSISSTSINGEIGGLVGAIDTGGLVTASDATGTVSGGGFGGGLVGVIAIGASVTGSHASTNVSGSVQGWSGGLVGVNHGTLTTSYASGSALTGTGAGGLVGGNQGGSIDQCFATGAATGDETGGLAGNNTGTITNSYATGTVGGVTSGGLVGIASNAGESIAASYASNNVTGSSSAGGLIGDDALPASAGNSYWNISGNITNPSQGAGSPANDPGITGLTTTQLQSGLPSGFNPSVWGSNPSINGGLPYLLALPPS
jgi:The GLUG motif